MVQDEITTFLAGPGDLQTRIPFRVSRLHNQFQAYTRRLLRDRTGLGLSEWRMMVVLATKAPCIAAEIVRLTALDKAQVSKALKGLEAKGLVASKSTADARQRQLQLSDYGRKVYADAAPEMNARRHKLIEGLSEQDLETFFAVLNHLEGHMQ